MKKTVAQKHNLKFGGGFGIYSGAKLEMTFDDIAIFGIKKYTQEYESATGVHFMIQDELELNPSLYQSATGVHFMIQDEFELNPSLYLVGGAKFYSVSYKEKDTFVTDGTTFHNDEQETVDGGGVDFTIGIVKKF